MIKFIDLKENLKTADYPALCLFGNDLWVKHRALDNICSAYGVVDDGFAIDNLDNPTVDDIVLSCTTPSMFGNKKIVVCNNFPLPKSDKSPKWANDKQTLSRLINNADGSFCLVIVADDYKVYDGIANLQTVDCNRLPLTSVTKWITSYCARQGVSVDSACASKLATFCLCDMARVETETKKLLDYGEISVTTVEQMVHKDVEYIIYDLSKYIADKNAAKATELYNGLIAQDNDARNLFTMLYNFYRRVYYVKTSNFDDATMAQYLGVRQGAIGFAKDVAQNYKPMQLRRALEFFRQAQQKLLLFIDDNQVMSLLIYQLINL